MSISSLYALPLKAALTSQDIENTGHFIALNLNYDSSIYEVKRNADQLIKEINSDLKSYDEMIADISSDEPFLRSEMDFKRKLLLKINDANRILSNDEVIFLSQTRLILFQKLRSNYLHDIKIRCFLSQCPTTNELYEKFCKSFSSLNIIILTTQQLAGRIFPFFIFEVDRINKNIFTEKQHEFLCLNFIEMILEEIKGSQLVRSYNFSSIKQAISGFKADELYVTITNGDEPQTFHYRAASEEHRDLLIELVNFSKEAAQKRSASKSENLTNPNYVRKKSEKSIEHILSIVCKNTSNQNPTSDRSLKLLHNDRILPIAPLFQCEVLKKSGSIIVFEKKAWLTIGCSNIIISKDQQIKNIIQIFPINSNSLLVKPAEKGKLVITSNHVKSIYQANSLQDADMVIEVIKAILSGKYENEQIVSSLPYNKMDNNVAKILSKKLKRVNKDIVTAKSQVHNLKAKRKEIQESLTKEKRKNSTLSNLNQTSIKSLIIPSKSCISSEEKTSLGNLDEKQEVPVYRSQTSLSPIKRGKLMKVLEVAESPEFTRKNSQESLILDHKLNAPESDISFREDKNLYSKKTWTDSEVSSGQNIANTITSLGNFEKMNSGRGSRKKLTFTESVEKYNSKTTTSAGSRELDRGGSEGFLNSDRTSKSILRDGDSKGKLKKLYERNFINNSHGRFDMKIERLAAM